MFQLTLLFLSCYFHAIVTNGFLIVVPDGATCTNTAVTPSRIILTSRTTTTTTTRQQQQQEHATVSLNMNVFSDIGDMLTGGKLVPQTEPLPYGMPLLTTTAGSNDVSQTIRTRTFAIQERLLTWTGEDFDVQDIDQNKPFVRVKGALLHLPGKDKMRILDCAASDGNNKVLATMERKLLALKPTYQIYRGDGTENIGWMEKAALGFKDTFDFHVQSQQQGLFKPPAAYKIVGELWDRNFVVKNAAGQVVAKVSKDRLVEFDAYDHYQVQVAAGMDPVIVIAFACAIDEEFDREHEEESQ